MYDYCKPILLLHVLTTLVLAHYRWRLRRNMYKQINSNIHNIWKSAFAGADRTCNSVTRDELVWISK